MSSVTTLPEALAAAAGTFVTTLGTSSGRVRLPRTPTRSRSADFSEVY
jgi:hypothetical protein